MKTVIFDFDGTIADTFNTGIEIYNRIAGEMGCKQVSKEQVEQLRNKRPQEFMHDFGVTFFKLPKLVLRMKKELLEHIEDIEIQPGIYDTIKELEKEKFQLGIMTSNSEENTWAFLEKNKLEDEFEFVYSGKNLFGKDKVLKKIVKEKKLNIDEIIYVGDETRDIEGCKKAGIKIISVTWGFNNNEVLSTLQPDFLIDQPKQILNILN